LSGSLRSHVSLLSLGSGSRSLEQNQTFLILFLSNVFMNSSIRTRRVTQFLRTFSRTISMVVDGSFANKTKRTCSVGRCRVLARATSQVERSLETKMRKRPCSRQDMFHNCQIKHTTRPTRTDTQPTTNTTKTKIIGEGVKQKFGKRQIPRMAYDLHFWIPCMAHKTSSTFADLTRTRKEDKTRNCQENTRMRTKRTTPPTQSQGATNLEQNQLVWSYFRIVLSYLDFLVSSCTQSCMFLLAL
jgi:hypothetical protein